jgi:phosphoribosylamine--glycine ligase
VSRTQVCVVGSGGREHALCLALARVADVIAAPGSAGMVGAAGTETAVRTAAAGTGAGTETAVRAGAIWTTSHAPEEIDADLFVIGPEGPLVAGLADRLRARGRRVVGPGADGARLEGSKAYMKEVLAAAGVPTAHYGAFSSFEEARAFLRGLPGPWVVKTDGLASGKGVTVASSLEEAEADVAAKLGGRFGEAGRTVVIEEGLSGVECSLLVLCDGTTLVPMAPAQDFKRLGDGDRGPNTGGMGAYAPVPSLGADDVDELVDRAVAPVLSELVRRGIDYRGVLYAGLMLTDEGPRVLEFNVRFGDPEAQVVLPLLAEDPVALLGAVADGRLASAVPTRRLARRGTSTVCVVLAADGYPTAPVTGAPIEGLDAGGQLLDPVPGVTVVHAATKREPPDGPFLVAGGRVLGVTAEAPSLAEARRRAYAAVERITWPGVRWRADIAAEAAATEAAAASARLV